MLAKNQVESSIICGKSAVKIAVLASTMSHHHIAHSDGLSVSKRAEAAALGAVVADAATMPAQWCYDQAKLAAIEGDIAFYPSHIAPWYAARKVCKTGTPPYAADA